MTHLSSHIPTNTYEIYKSILEIRKERREHLNDNLFKQLADPDDSLFDLFREKSVVTFLKDFSPEQEKKFIFPTRETVADSLVSLFGHCALNHQEEIAGFSDLVISYSKHANTGHRDIAPVLSTVADCAKNAPRI